MSNRDLALREWVDSQLPNPVKKLTFLSGDASFRRYYRASSDACSYVVMDAPPNLEPIAPFIKNAKLLQECGVCVPDIFACDLNAGFVLLRDFGDRLLLDLIYSENSAYLYQKAIDELLNIQKCQNRLGVPIATFDKDFMMEEMRLCLEWFLLQYLNYPLSHAELQLLETTFTTIAEQIETQPKVLIHRDYHSRNIMVLDQSPPIQLGIIDFQDAMFGPYSYDLVSLGKDCYVEWPRKTQLTWLEHYYHQQRHVSERPFSAVIDDYDYCGLQRHIKILGVFSRLHLRDGKSGYLANIPLTLKYILNCLEYRGWMPEFFHFLQRISLP